MLLEGDFVEVLSEPPFPPPPTAAHASYNADAICRLVLLLPDRFPAINPGDGKPSDGTVR